MKLRGIVRNNFDIEISGMPDLIYELSKSNSLILYSDHANEWICYIQEKHSFMQHFKKTVFSFEQKCLKSDKNAFPDLLQLLRINYSEILFIDDNIENIQNAAKSGINTILFKNKIEQKKALNSLKIT